MVMLGQAAAKYFRMGLYWRYSLVWLIGFGALSFLYLVVSVNKMRPVSVPIYPPPDMEQSSLCSAKFKPEVAVEMANMSEPVIYFITPTYSRREQIAELTRLGQTLLLAENVHWVVAEDSPSCSHLVAQLLARLGVPYTHLSSPQPLLYREARLKFNPRGVSSRRAGLHWVSLNNPTTVPAVIYFADDDNTYDIRLFKEIAKTQKISMFPVGFIGAAGVSSPIVKNGKVVGFSDEWFAQRKWPVDMAGFAVNLAFIRKMNPQADTAMPYKAGYEEDMFLQNLRISLNDIEPLANNCTEVLVWHTKTVKEKKLVLSVDEKGENSSLGKLLRHMETIGMADVTQGGRPLKTCYGGKQCRT